MLAELSKDYLVLELISLLLEVSSSPKLPKCCTQLRAFQLEHVCLLKNQNLRLPPSNPFF